MKLMHHAVGNCVSNAARRADGGAESWASNIVRAMGAARPRPPTSKATAAEARGGGAGGRAWRRRRGCRSAPVADASPPGSWPNGGFLEVRRQRGGPATAESLRRRRRRRSRAMASGDGEDRRTSPPLLLRAAGRLFREEAPPPRGDAAVPALPAAGARRARLRVRMRRRVPRQWCLRSSHDRRALPASPPFARRQRRRGSPEEGAPIRCGAVTTRRPWCQWTASDTEGTTGVRRDGAARKRTAAASVLRSRRSSPRLAQRRRERAFDGSRAALRTAAADISRFDRRRGARQPTTQQQQLAAAAASSSGGGGASGGQAPDPAHKHTHTSWAQSMYSRLSLSLSSNVLTPGPAAPAQAGSSSARGGSAAILGIERRGRRVFTVRGVARKAAERKPSPRLEVAAKPGVDDVPRRSGRRAHRLPSASARRLLGGGAQAGGAARVRPTRRRGAAWSPLSSSPTVDDGAFRTTCVDAAGGGAAGARRRRRRRLRRCGRELATPRAAGRNNGAAVVKWRIRAVAPTRRAASRADREWESGEAADELSA